MATKVLMCLAFIFGLVACTVAMISLLKWRRNMLVAATSCFGTQGNDSSLHTVEPLTKDPPNKEYSAFDLSMKDKFYGPYRIMTIECYLGKRVTSV